MAFGIHGAVPRIEDSLNPKEFKVTASCQEGRWTQSAMFGKGLRWLNKNDLKLSNPIQVSRRVR